MQKFTKLYFLAVSLCAVTLFSCSKDDDGGSPSSTKDCIITNVSSSNGTNQSSETYEYNAQRQVTKLTFTENGVASPDYQTVEYNGAGQISKSTYFEAGTAAYYETYEYNSNGLLTKVSEFYDNSGSSGPLVFQASTTYQYNADKKLVKRENFDEQNVKTGENVYTYPSATTAKKETFDVDATGAATLSYVVDYTFDDKKNPQMLMGVLFDDETISFSNVLTERETQAGSTTADVATYAYEYNEQGYPTKVTRTFNGSTRVSNLVYNCK